jgi:hypothetical protein
MSYHYYVGMDLHSDNVIGVMIDESERWVLKRKFKPSISIILSTLEPYKKNLVDIGLEATNTWYWIVDGLREAGYRVHSSVGSSARD